MKYYNSFKQKNNTNFQVLMNHIVNTISLPSFIEEETGEKLFWSQIGKSAKCCCPFHLEDIPSLHINFKDEKIWVYHCFGCGAKGHIVHFCKNYYKFNHIQDAVKYICEKYNIQQTEDVFLNGFENFKVNVDQNRVLENMNILFSNQCRILLRKNFNLHKKWVHSSYKSMNRALELGSCEEIEKLNFEAHKRLLLGREHV